MQTNSLHSYVADESSIAIHRADGFTLALITDGRVSLRGTDALRPVELLHLAEIAEQFTGFHAIAFAGQNYSQQLMPIVKS